MNDSACIIPIAHEGKYRSARTVYKQVLGWSRDEHGDVTNRHPVDVANCVTSGKRDNTQNYVMEQTLLNGDSDNCASTITTSHNFAGNIVNPKGGHKQMGVMEREGRRVRIRRLTERELFRLMDVEETDIDILLSAGISKTQLAKMAGNSIVVACLYYIFRNLLVETEPEAGTQTKLF